MTLQELNELNPGDAAIVLTKCCGSTKWINEIVESRPYATNELLLEIAEKAWFYCFEEDWLEAFKQHPKIGDTASLEKKFSSTKEWAGDEQKGVAEATTETIEKLTKLNQVYEDKFEFIFK